MGEPTSVYSFLGTNFETKGEDSFYFTNFFVDMVVGLWPLLGWLLLFFIYDFLGFGSILSIFAYFFSYYFVIVSFSFIYVANRLSI